MPSITAPRLGLVAMLALGSTAVRATPANASVGCTKAPVFRFVRRVATASPTGTLTLSACVAGQFQTLTVPAGSGRVEDDCVKNAGWLPLGTYPIIRHTTAGAKGFNGIIKGTTWGIGSKRCTKGRTRTELFIHSEMTKSGGQGTPGTLTLWDGNQDYRSKGCIKVNPSDIAALDALYNRADRSRGAGTVTVTA